MKLFLGTILVMIPGLILAQSDNSLEQGDELLYETDNTFFKKDKFWRGADGAASIDLGNGKVLWLFSDTFIDTTGSGKRTNSAMINNSIAIQDGYDLTKSQFSYYYGGTHKTPQSFFKPPEDGDHWFWTGDAIKVRDKLIVFLMEEVSSTKGMGFKASGWSVAIINNPNENPDNWNISYKNGPDTYGVIIGSSAVLKDSNYVYAFGVKEPSSHEVYLVRFNINSFIYGDLNQIEWWVKNSWTNQINEEPKSSSLFIGQTEFSVHYSKKLEKYIQIQTYGFGQVSIGYRLSDHLTGPWSEPVIFYTPPLSDPQEYMYTANAHPELKASGLTITYNVNNENFGTLVGDETLYFPKLINLRLDKIDQ